MEIYKPVVFIIIILVFVNYEKFAFKVAFIRCYDSQEKVREVLAHSGQYLVNQILQVLLITAILCVIYRASQGFMS